MLLSTFVISLDPPPPPLADKRFDWWLKCSRWAMVVIKYESLWKGDGVLILYRVHFELINMFVVVTLQFVGQRVWPSFSLVILIFKRSFSCPHNTTKAWLDHYLVDTALPVGCWRFLAGILLNTYNSLDWTLKTTCFDFGIEYVYNVRPSNTALATKSAPTLSDGSRIDFGGGEATGGSWGFGPPFMRGVRGSPPPEKFS